MIIDSFRLSDESIAKRNKKKENIHIPFSYPPKVCNYISP